MFALGCTVKEPVTSPGGRISPAYQGPAELPVCTTAITYGGGVTIQGNAEYVRRNPFGTTGSSGGVPNGGLGSADVNYSIADRRATAHPIRKAEVRVTTKSGSLVQCSETDDNGNFSFQMPQNSTEYVLSVNSRSGGLATNDFVGSVLDAPERNQFYTLQTSFTPDSSKTLPQLTAAADGDVLGGAFNILDQIYEANIYLRAQAGSGICNFTGCQAFTVAPKVFAYWEKGFNPNSYFGSSSGLSFYLPGYSRLFILGGQSGDVNSSDTDHFDNSVVLHEYGHFLEDVMFDSDSPGGPHNGNRIIDPRLAWSEGWGNFFQAAVIYGPAETPYYTDTIGNIDGSTSMIFNTNLETQSLISSDIPTATGIAGEGIFREFSVTRLLWDLIDTTSSVINDNESVTGAFDEIWASLTKTSNGFNDTDWAFKNAGHLHIAQGQISPAGQSWNSARTVENHVDDNRNYAQYVTPNAGGCADFTMAPGTVTATSFSNSNLIRANKFYHLKLTGTATRTLVLTYTYSGTAKPDLDLYLYNESARYGVGSDMLGRSENEPAAGTGAETETITRSLGPGNYLINVRVFSAANSPGTISYSLTLGGVELCAASL